MGVMTLFDGDTLIDGARSLFGLGVDGGYYSVADYSQRSIIGRAGVGVYYVIQKKESGTGGLMFRMETGIVTSTSSVGAPAELLRVTNVLDLVQAVAFKRNSSVSNAAHWSRTTPTYSGESSRTSINSGAQYDRTTTQNAWIEYTCTVPATGNLHIGLYGTAGSSSSVKVTVDGVDVETFSLVTTPTGVVVKTYAVGAGAHTVRVTKLDSSAAGLQIYGVNFVSLENLHTASDMTDQDCLGYHFTANDYITNKGAADYAISSKTANLLAGSYHGGETIISRVFRSAIGDVALAVNGVAAVSSLGVEQQTLIAWGNGEFLRTASIHRFGSGQYALSYKMSGSVLASYFFSVMSTTASSFNEITAPVSHTFTGLGETIDLGDVTSVTQRNSTTGQTITNTFSPQDLTNNSQGAYVLEVPGSYNKVYYGPIVAHPTGVPLGGIQQLCVKNFA